MHWACHKFDIGRDRHTDLNDVMYSVVMCVSDVDSDGLEDHSVAIGALLHSDGGDHH